MLLSFLSSEVFFFDLIGRLLGELGMMMMMGSVSFVMVFYILFVFMFVLWLVIVS